MADLPPELQKNAAFLEAQPAPLQTAYQYCLCLIMVEAGKMELIETTSDEHVTLCTFRTRAGDTFSTVKPAVNQGQEAALIKMLKIKLELE